HAYVSRGERHVEKTVRVRPGHSALDIENVAAREHDGQRLNPFTRGAMFERRRPRSIGCDGSTDEGAGEGRRRRIVTANVLEGEIEIRERDARADSDGCGRGQVPRPR